MKIGTAYKRIVNACKKEPLINNEVKLKRMVEVIYRDFLLFEDDVDNDYHTSTENLNFAIAIHLNEGDDYILSIIED